VLPQDGATVDLGGMGGEDDLDLLLEQLLVDLFIVDSDEFGDGPLEAVLPDELVVVLPLLGPDHPEPVVVLSDVDEVESVGKDPRDCDVMR
jgi:hypothetical protein